MTDVLDNVRDHYRATGLTERLTGRSLPSGQRISGSRPSSWPRSTSFTPVGSPPRPSLRTWLESPAT